MPKPRAFAVPAPIIPLRFKPPESGESIARKGIRETQEVAELALEHWALSPPDDPTQVAGMERIRDRCAYVLARPQPDDIA